MEFLFLIAGLLLGFALAWLIKKAPTAGDQGKELTDIRTQYMTALQEGSAHKSANEHLSQEKQKLTETIQTQQESLYKLNAEVASASSLNKTLEQKLTEQKAELGQLQQQFTKEFENLANRIFEEKSKKFTDQNKVNLDEILKPFNEKIKSFEKKVDETYDKEMRDKISLREEVKKLYELNAKISEEAHNLTKALKGDTKKQGNWGELILEKVLERSGLVKDREYKVQVVTKNAEGDIIKPDVVVFLPDQKHIIIDSKVSLTAYEQLVNSESAADYERLLKEHLNSVRSHVKLLSDKNYFTSEEFSSPDFVLLFMPLESAFSAAVQYDPELFGFAWEKRIVMVSPATLLATLKTVESIWKIEKQNRNTQEIVKQAGALYDKFKGFVDDLLEIGKKMDDSKKAYEEGMKKLATGSGNLVRKVEQIKLLGARADKSLPASLLDRANEDG